MGIDRTSISKLEDTSNVKIHNACIPDLRYKIKMDLVKNLSIFRFSDPERDPRCFIRESLGRIYEGLVYIEWSFIRGELPQDQFVELSGMLRKVLRNLSSLCPRKEKLRMWD